MKKLLISALLGTFALTAQANNFYVQGDLGLSVIGTTDTDVKISDSAFDQRVSVGYQFGDWRAAIDYSNFGKVEGNDEEYNISLKIKSVGISGFYDIQTGSDFKPYVGLRIAKNNAKVIETANRIYDCSRSGCNYTSYEVDNYTTSRVGIGVIGGVQYKLNNNLKLNLAAEYNRIAADVYQAGVKAGLRFDF